MVWLELDHLSYGKEWRCVRCIWENYIQGNEGTFMFLGLNTFPLPHDYPFYWPAHIGYQVKTRLIQSYKFKEFAKTRFLKLVKKTTLQVTHLLKLLDNMWTKRTQFCPQTDWRTDKVKPVYHPSTSLSEGYTKLQASRCTTKAGFNNI